MGQTILDKGKAVFEKFGLYKVVLFDSEENGRSLETVGIGLLAFSFPKKQYWHELE